MQEQQQQQVYGSRADKSTRTDETSIHRETIRIQNVPQQRPDSVEAFFDAQAYLQHYLYTPQGTPAPLSPYTRVSVPPQARIRPSVPIPPTPRGQTSAHSPLP